MSIWSFPGSVNHPDEGKPIPPGIYQIAVRWHGGGPNRDYDLESRPFPYAVASIRICDAGPLLHEPEALERLPGLGRTAVPVAERRLEAYLPSLLTLPFLLAAGGALALSLPGWLRRWRRRRRSTAAAG